MEQGIINKRDFRYNRNPCIKCRSRTEYLSDHWRCNGCACLVEDKNKKDKGFFIGTSTVINDNDDYKKKPIKEVAENWLNINFVGGDIQTYIKMNKKIISLLIEEIKCLEKTKK